MSNRENFCRKLKFVKERKKFIEYLVNINFMRNMYTTAI